MIYTLFLGVRCILYLEYIREIVKCAFDIFSVFYSKISDVLFISESWFDLDNISG